MATTMSITEIKRNWDDVIERATAGERIIITKWGRPIAAMESAVPEIIGDIGTRRRRKGLARRRLDAPAPACYP